MIQKENYKILLEEHKLIGKQIIARQPIITFAEALEQTRRLKKIPTVKQQSKKSRVNS